MSVIPISETEIDTIINTLWQPLETGETPNVFAVLDGARDKRIEPMLNNGDLEYSCLYEGQLSYAMQRAAPHVVALDKHHAVTRKILRTGWGNSWGIFFVSRNTIPLSTIRANCRRLAKVKGLNGKNLVFRYYDPRVANYILPVCNQHEIECLFGAATSLVMEGENSLDLIVYQRGDETTPLIIKNTNTCKLSDSLLNAPNKHPEHSWRDFFQIRQVHMDAMQKKLNNEEFSIIRQYYIECFINEASDEENDAVGFPVNISEFAFNIGGKSVNLDMFLRLCFNKAKEFNLDTQASILAFIQMNHHYGWLFG